MAQEFKALLNTYKRMFGMVDVFHFNSQNARNVYEHYLSVPEISGVVPITHNGVADHRRVRNYDGKVLTLGFVGNEAPYKGLPMLKRVIARINEEGYEDRVRLIVYGGRVGADEVLTNVEYKGRFASEKMELVYNSMDLLIVPSIWCETFGLTTIEGIQFGVPVLVSSKVGAQDVVRQYAPQFVFGTEEDLYQTVKRLMEDRSELEKYNKRITDASWPWSMKRHVKELEQIIYKDHSCPLNVQDDNY